MRDDRDERRLSARKEAILRALVEEHIRTAEPVASKQLSDQLALVHGSGYASATVRNDSPPSKRTV